MRIPTHLRTFLILFVCWFCANVLLYFGIQLLEATWSPTQHRISRRTLTLFSAAASDAAQQGENRPTSLNYRLMSPTNVRPDQQFPLLVFLHGSGEKGDDNQSQLLGFPEQMSETVWRRRFPCFLLAPQCPQTSHWTNLDSELTDLIRGLMAQQPIDPRRVYLTGLSMGGFGCWKVSAKEPALFAAVVPICGGGDPSWADQLVQVPIWAVHGNADTAVPVEQSRTMIEAIRKAGGYPNYTELDGVGHDSWTQTYRDPNGVLSWMFQQVNNRRALSP
jgi:predicted peptidase